MALKHRVDQTQASGAEQRRPELQNVGRVAPVELTEEDMLDEEEDVGVLRLMRLQAALKEKHILESEG